MWVSFLAGGNHFGRPPSFLSCISTLRLQFVLQFETKKMSDDDDSKWY